MSDYINKLDSIIRSSINVVSLEIIDESSKHFGHAGAKEGGNSHFFIKIVSPDFKGLTKIAQHKLVYKALDQELKQQIHALSLETGYPN